jgi:hypothetical protein
MSLAVVVAPGVTLEFRKVSEAVTLNRPVELSGVSAVFWIEASSEFKPADHVNVASTVHGRIEDRFIARPVDPGNETRRLLIGEARGACVRREQRQEEQQGRREAKKAGWTNSVHGRESEIRRRKVGGITARD